MPTWGEILAELHRAPAANGGPDFDGIRRKYLAQLFSLTGRPTILYYSDWIAGGSLASSMTLEDIQGFMETVRGLPDGDLDLILHLPGGQAEATLRVVEYLRQKFSGEIRAFVPVAAMSAGTMLALACDRIVMGSHSQLGPIDPQILQPQQGRFVPARAILDQFDLAQDEIAQNPAKLAAWVPILQQYGTSLLIECQQSESLAKDMVRRWLRTYMLQQDHAKADAAADWFANYKVHRSHALGISRDDARGMSIVVDDLEQDQQLQDAVLSVHHATMHTMQGPVVKIIENHVGKAFAKLENVMPAIQIGPPRP